MSTSNHTTDPICIPITQGQFAFISPEDADLGDLKWWAYKYNETYYVRRNSSSQNGKRRTLHLHQIIMERMLGRSLIKGEEVDHKDLNPLNNQRTNLRIASHSENMKNRRRHKTNKSGYKGVCFDKNTNKWRAEIQSNGRCFYLGLFGSPELAYAAYCEAAITYHGEFFNAGNPKP